MTALPNLTRALRALLGGDDRFGAKPFAGLTRAYDIACQNVRYFYLASTLYVWLFIPTLHNSVIHNPPLEHAWPLIWAKGLPILVVVDVISIACATFAALAFWKPANVLWRAGFSLTLLMCAAVPVSLGGVNHGYHEWIWISFILIFLPAQSGIQPDRAAKLSYCLTFGAAQGLILLFYTMAGSWKALYGFAALFRGEPGNFSPDALGWTLADRMAQTNTEPLLGPFLVEYSILAWPMFVGLIFVQLVAIAVAFRPSLHALWGWILIAFHTGTFLMMEIAFPTHIAILLFLLVASPFQRGPMLSWETLHHLPVIGGIFKRLMGSAQPVSTPPISKGGEAHALPNL